MLLRPVSVLPPEPFEGAGIYAIYYVGKFPAYKQIADKNINNQFTQPVYVGKAIPNGGRKGRGLDLPHGPALYQRLKHHAESIKQAKNLNIKDFHCRYLVVDDIWIPLGESLLVQMFQPIWNKVIDGFGIKTPGKNRIQARSQWDTIHPGRTFVSKLNLLPNPASEKEILANLISFLAGGPAKTIEDDDTTAE